ncbi:2-aminoethylphosphonate ABC transporter permease subunit [Paraburkholderia silvatlantica]|uniref:2-aminoethylphosphonate ABC transporter permease protein n=1 Tax=Paraburkholderia silvatlantica TaxID=321895 RepID=A0A2U1AGQ1_9BURK|nr:2-aminoethylphosphonate ABC transporter permease subunit [Paraburkholderia silvatlantica]PVY35559.1 2-aminoethylphosphonate ABC transporter permease protein [Paraburkholderia silvatlantica]PXW41201.1 2-aminoethylphosphonate ABC transporter permease protein [Paraburkholderia silvatlantica]PYE27666.1 2-aminoethylphosphonate ABC transporter permease protein [Paraburkholderia silvatlantica]TDQ76283.1 2-aminoethylphosphonate ABC transporter permease protein [Paraburkholderia silvatlantica]
MSSLSPPDSAVALPGADAHAAAVRRRERRAQWHIACLLVFVLGPLVVYPLVRLVLLSLAGAHGLSFHAYETFFGNPDSRGVIATTLWILFLSAGLASVLGVALAALLFFKPFPGAQLVTRFLELFVAFPSFLVAFTLIFLYGSQGSVSIGLQRLFHLQSPPLDFLFGIGGVVLAEVVFYAPFVVRPTLAAFALLDMRLIEAARSLGANSRMVALRVILPLAWPGIAAGTILCFLLTFNEFGILLVLGSAHLITLPVAIYSSATVDLDLPAAAAGAVVMLAMSLSLYALYRRVNRRSHGGARNVN